METDDPRPSDASGASDSGTDATAGSPAAAPIPAGATPEGAATPEAAAIAAGAGTVVAIDPAGRRTFVAAPGSRLLVGGDPAATIRVVDPVVGPRFAVIERQGPGWLVTSLDPANPIWILDDTGRAHPVMEQLGLRSATLLAGSTQLLLFPPN